MAALATKKSLQKAEVRDQAAGHWLEIFRSLCPGMFDDAINHLGDHVTCPFHGGENDFRFIKKVKIASRTTTAESGVAMCTCGKYSDGFSVLMRATGWTFPEVLEEVDAWLNGRSAPLPVQAVTPKTTAEDDLAEIERLRAKVVTLWNAGKPLDVDYVPYYRERGIHRDVILQANDLRFLPSLGYYAKVDKKLEKIGSYPAILALMRGPDGQPVAVHRTWLSADKTGKAPVLKAKKLSETCGASGAAIRMFNAVDSDILGLCEGVETGASVRQLAESGYWPEFGERKVPVWPCYSEGNIRSFIVPQDLLRTLKTIVVFADHDEKGTGYAAAMAFKERMAAEHPHLTVLIKMPEVPGFDWNDVLLNL